MERLYIFVCWFKGMGGESLWRDHDSRAALWQKGPDQDRAKLGYFSQAEFSFSTPIPLLCQEKTLSNHSPQNGTD